MHSFADVIAAFGSSSEFARATGIDTAYARVLKSRGSIPPHYWPAVIRAGRRRGIPGLTYDLLAKLAAERKRQPEVNAA